MNWLVTGGAGFIGTNLVKRLVQEGHEVSVLDDLSRAGVDSNAKFLKRQFGISVSVVDVADADHLNEYLAGHSRFEVVAHLAGQVSYMESLRNPVRDFKTNIWGTINILEHVRQHSPETVVIGMSSNKIYGDLSQITIDELPSRYVAPEFPHGFDEHLPLDFRGPYGCSKGAMDQYLLDYGQSYGLHTVSLRQSAVFGPHQHPQDDQGWVSFMVQQATFQHEIKLNGVGKQVRDVLYVEDLVDLFLELPACARQETGICFNVGGGEGNAVSILELFDILKQDFGLTVRYTTGFERPGDQKVFVADVSKVWKHVQWRPITQVRMAIANVLDHS